MNKFYLIFLVIFIISILSISAVSASDDDDASDILMDANGDIIIDHAIDDFNIDDNDGSVVDDNIDVIIDDNDGSVVDDEDIVDIDDGSDGSVVDDKDAVIDDKDASVIDDDSNDEIIIDYDAISKKKDTNDKMITNINSKKDLNDMIKLINENYVNYFELDQDYVITEPGERFEGYVLDCDLIINGKGHILEGNHWARIFIVRSPHVVKFMNINFLHANVPDFQYGGAIWAMGEGSCAINCTFDGCCGSYGGALCGVDAIDCTFVNNWAWDLGGGLYHGNAINCIFRHNKADYYGGAFSYGNATNCTFIDNVARINGGGAIAGVAVMSDTGYMEVFSSAINCTFSCNDAYDYKNKDFYNCNITNCTFLDNDALKSAPLSVSTFIANGASDRYVHYSSESSNAASLNAKSSEHSIDSLYDKCIFNALIHNLFSSSSDYVFCEKIFFYLSFKNQILMFLGLL